MASALPRWHFGLGAMDDGTESEFGLQVGFGARRVPVGVRRPKHA